VASQAAVSRKKGFFAPRRFHRGEFNFKDTLIFLGPILVFILILYGLLSWTIYVSFTNWHTIAPDYSFSGTKWYEFLFAQPEFSVTILNNLKWLTLGVIPTVILAVLLAYVLELAPFSGVESYVRTLILYPVAMSFIVTGTIWSWMYEPNKGVFNTLINLTGLHSNFNYVNNPDTATFWLILIFIWQYLGFAVIIVQSSFRTSELQEMVEAATVDGASKIRILISIIIPNIRAGLLVLVSLLLINTLKVFDIVYIVTNGGPGISTDVLAFNMWSTFFQQHLVAAGAGLGTIIFIMAFIIVVPYTIYAFRKWFE
jgi:ABC-type sugar transport system permease subunit